MLVDEELLRQINCTASIVIATSPNFSHARSEQRIATVKSAPFAVAQPQLEAVISILRERGPILQARPIRSAAIAVLYTDPLNGERARQLFEPVVRQRLERFGVAPSYALAPTEEEGSVARALRASAPRSSHRHSGRLHVGSGRTRRRGRPGHGPHRLPSRAFPRSRGAW